MRSYSQDFIAKCRLQADQADDTLLNNLLVEYMHMFFTLEVSERHEIEQQLLQLGSSKDEKLQMICQMFDKKIAEAGKRQTDNAKDQEEESRCDPQRMREAVDRFLKKLQFAAGFEISRSPLPLTLGLQRASDGLDVASQLDPTYNLSKVSSLTCMPAVLTKDSFPDPSARSGNADRHSGRRSPDDADLQFGSDRTRTGCLLCQCGLCLASAVFLSIQTTPRISSFAITCDLFLLRYMEAQ